MASSPFNIFDNTTEYVNSSTSGTSQFTLQRFYAIRVGKLVVVSIYGKMNNAVSSGGAELPLARVPFKPSSACSGNGVLLPGYAFIRRGGQTYFEYNYGQDIQYNSGAYYIHERLTAGLQANDEIAITTVYFTD